MAGVHRDSESGHASPPPSGDRAGERFSVVAYGPLSEVVPAGLVLEVVLPASAAEVRRRLEERVPALDGAVFRLAVNARFVEQEQAIEAGGELAVLPPFAGG